MCDWRVVRQSHIHLEHQKTIFIPIWTFRGRLFWLVTLPKVELRGLVSGSPNCGWLKALRNSPRSWNLTFSVIEKFLITERSHRFSGWRRNPVRRDGKVRMLLASLMRVSARCLAGSIGSFNVAGMLGLVGFV